MSLRALAELEDAAPEAPRQRMRDGIRTATITVPAKDGHLHCALYNAETGDGFTTPGPDGHVHQVRALDVMPAAGHAHDLSARRCPERHDRHDGHHVQARK